MRAALRNPLRWNERNALLPLHLGGLPIIPMGMGLIGAVLVLGGVVAGPELIAFGMLGALCFAVISAWVVLVEIRR